MHMRTQIRNALMSRLTSLAQNPNSMFAGKTNFVQFTRTGGGFQRANCPAIEVVPGEEKSVIASIGTPRTMNRLMEIGVVGAVVCGDVDDLQGIQDELANEVEAVLLDGTFLDGLVMDLRLVSTMPSKSSASTDPSGFIDLSFEVEYCTFEGNPSNT